MVLKLKFCILLITLTVGCKLTDNTAKINTKKYEGWWINTTIADSTINKRSIYSSRSLWQQDAVMFEISNDTIYTYGSVINKMRFPINSNSDTLATIQGMSQFNIVINNEFLLATTKRRTKEYSELFRRATSNEKNQLIWNISKTNTIAKNLEIYFAKEVLSGKYKDDEGKSIKLLKNRECIGFENYSKFETHFTDGTMDWMSNDWIKFTDTVNNDSAIYHFEFEGKYLNLFEYLMVDVEGKWEVGELKHKWTINKN